MQDNKKRTGRVNYVWVLAGGYLIYLAAKLFRGMVLNRDDFPWVNLASGVFFVVCGALMLRREWKAYRYGETHKDDPSTWSDDPVETMEPVDRAGAGVEGDNAASGEDGENP